MFTLVTSLYPLHSLFSTYLYQYNCIKIKEMVVAQLAEPLLPTPYISEFLYWTFFRCQLCWNHKSKDRRGRELPILKENANVGKREAQLMIICHHNSMDPSAHTILRPGSHAQQLRFFQLIFELWCVKYENK